MELKFIWIKKHIVIKELGFNFNHSGEHRFEYTNNTLHLLPNPKFSVTFGLNVTGVTVIAGQNGSGKSSLCECILQSTATLTNGALGINVRFEGIVCFGDHIFIHEELLVHNVEQLKSKGYQIVLFKDSPFEQMKHEWLDTFAKGGFIYYSNILDYRTDLDETNLANISTLAALNDSSLYSTSYPTIPRFRGTTNGDHDKDKHGPFQIHYNVEGNRIVDFYLKHPQLTTFISFHRFIIKSTYPGNNRWLNIDNSNIGERNDSFFWYSYSLNNILNDIFNSIFDFTTRFDHDTTASINQQELKNVIKRLYRYNLTIVLAILDNVLPKIQDVRDFVFDEKVYINDARRDDIISLIKQHSLIVEASSVIDHEQFKPSVMSYQFEDTEDWRFYLAENIYLENNESHRALLLDFSEREKDLVRGDVAFRRITNLNLNPLSSGEQSLLTLFARLHDVVQRYNTGRYEKERLILFIDEAEIGFHPEWKRMYLDRLLHFLNNYIEGYKFQIIMTTHSPYLLSDLPHSNIILLKRRPNDVTTVVDASNFKTFGANINELLSKSFFLEDGLIGEFARKKIQNLIDNLQTDQSHPLSQALSKEEMNQIIDFIAEPFLHQKLREMFYNKYPEEFQNEKEKQARIQTLQNELRRLQNG